MWSHEHNLNSVALVRQGYTMSKHTLYYFYLLLLIKSITQTGNIKVFNLDEKSGANLSFVELLNSPVSGPPEKFVFCSLNIQEKIYDKEQFHKKIG